jgi:ubiquinone/menaquinone biosynthesis C-methylase UbiE
MEEHFQKVATGFSGKAAEYDSFGPGEINIERMRQKVYAHVESYLKPGETILEMNAGTGIDATHFALRGHPVHAIDIAPGMVEAIAQKVSTYGLNGQLTYCNCSFTDLACLIENAPYDYLFSNFGGLNCIPDLGEVARLVSQVILPGGRLTWVIMPTFCPWDLVHAYRGEWRMATRRFQRGGTLAHVEGQYFQVYYFSPERVLEALGKNFRLLRLQGLSIFAPPADWLSPKKPFNHWGDFFILTAEYRP